MALKVVGAGFGRTGTLSLKNALEKIGFGPCYHMMEVFPRPDHVAMWHRLAFGNPIDWDLMFRDFRATVDWPSARWWPEIAAYFADAKVLLSLRDPEAWYKSMSETIYQPMKYPAPAHAPELVRMQNEMVRKAILAETFENRFEDKAHTIEVFNRHKSRGARHYRTEAAPGVRCARRMGAAVPFPRSAGAERAVSAPQRHRIDAGDDQAHAGIDS